MQQNKTVITIKGKTGLNFTHSSEYTLEHLIWDAFLTVKHNKDQNDWDTMELIVQKLKGESPVEHLDINTQLYN